MVHRGQAVLLLVVAGLAAAVVGIVALNGTGIPATAVVRASSVAAPAAGLPSKISIGGTAAPAAGGAAQPSGGSIRATPGPGAGAAARDPAVQPGAGGVRQPARSPGAASTTVVPSKVYAYPPDDHGHGGHHS